MQSCQITMHLQKEICTKYKNKEFLPYSCMVLNLVDLRIPHDAQACENQYATVHRDAHDGPCGPYDVFLYVVLKPRDAHRQAHTVLSLGGLVSENKFDISLVNYLYPIMIKS